MTSKRQKASQQLIVIFQVSPYLVDKMMNEAVFTYTNLLPTSALNPDAENRSYWSSGEDQLLVLALEDAESTSTQDGSLPSKAKKESAFVAACKHVHNSFMKVHLF